jgi:phytoene desaturase
MPVSATKMLSLKEVCCYLSLVSICMGFSFSYYIVICAGVQATIAFIFSGQQYGYGVRNSRRCSVRPDVCIVGGGVGGLVTSSILAKKGLSTVLLEQNDEVCGGRMQSETLVTSDGNSTFRFDVGPSLLLLPSVYRKTFAMLGEDLDTNASGVELLKVDPLYRCFFEDGTEFDIPTNLQEMRSTIYKLLEEEEPFSPTPSDNQAQEKSSRKKKDHEEDTDTKPLHLYKQLEKYLSISSDFLAFGLPAVIEERPDWSLLPAFLGACFRSFPLLTHDSMLRSLFPNNPKIRAMLSFQDLYVGLAPQDAPAIFSLLQALEFGEGIYYPRGGFGTVARSLTRIAKANGVDVRLGTRVVGLETDSDSRLQLRRVILDPNSSPASCRHSASITDHFGDTPPDVRTYSEEDEDEDEDEEVGLLPAAASVLEAERFVFNVDAPFVENEWLPAQLRDERTARGRPSCSVVSLSLGLDCRLSPLAHHSIFFSNQFEDSWACLRKQQKHPKQQKEQKRMPCSQSESESESESAIPQFDARAFNFYVHAPMRTDTTCCSDSGHDAITVLVPVRPLSSTLAPPCKQEQEALAAHVRRAVLTRLQQVPGMPEDLESHIVAEKVRTPATWQSEFSLFRGAAFGLTHALSQLSLLRPRLRHPWLRNLYRVGASSRPGNGVPLVMIGARLAAEAVLRDVHAEAEKSQGPKTRGL